MSLNELREEIRNKIIAWQNNRRIEEGKIIAELFFGDHHGSIIKVGNILICIKIKGLHQSAVFHLTRDRRSLRRNFEIYCEHYIKVQPNVINAFIILAEKLDGKPTGEIDHIQSLKILSGLSLEEQAEIDLLWTDDFCLEKLEMPSRKEVNYQQTSQLYPVTLGNLIDLRCHLYDENKNLLQPNILNGTEIKRGNKVRFIIEPSNKFGGRNNCGIEIEISNHGIDENDPVEDIYRVSSIDFKEVQNGWELWRDVIWRGRHTLKVTIYQNRGDLWASRLFEIGGV